MNNPYRARPGKPRVDHTTVSNYGAQNQNAWGTMPGNQPGAPQNAPGVYPPQQHPVVSQPRKLGSGEGDSWEWGGDGEKNGNDAWNWSIEQPSESQIQQQHQKIVPPYQNSPENQDNYYKNLNGNKRPLPPPSQMPLPDGNIPRAIPIRESTPNQPDSWSNYSTNYSLNQQQGTLPRQNATTGNSSPNDHLQWQSINQPPVGRQEAPVPNAYMQPQGFELTNQANHQQQQQQQFGVHNYNWNTQQKNWPGEPQDSDHSRRSSQETVPTNQWQEETQRKPSLENNQRPSSTLSAQKPWNPPEVANTSPSWQNTSVHEPQPNQWPNQYQDMKKESPESVPNDIPKNSQQDWQQIDQTPIQFFSQATESVPSATREFPTKPTSLLTDVQLSSSKIEDRPGNESISDTTDVATHEHPESPWNTDRSPIGELSSNVSQMSLNHQPPTPFAHPPQPIPQGINQWSSQQNSHPTVVQHPKVFQQPGFPQQEQPVLVGNTQQTGGFHDFTAPQEPFHQSSPEDLIAIQNQSQNPHQNVTTENITSAQQIITPTLPQQSLNPIIPDILPENHHHHQVQQQQQIPEPAQVFDSFQPSANSLGTIPPTGYDQWYNQNSSQPPQASWYGDRTRSQTQWIQQAETPTAEPHENIQTPVEFIASEISQSTQDDATTPVETKSTPERIQHIQNSPQTEHPPAQLSAENYEFASNDRNTFLETGELTDAHHEPESTVPSQDDENDEVPSDIPFLREVPGQSSSADPRRNDPTGQEQYIQSSPRLPESRRNDPSGQSLLNRSLSERGVERRDVPPGQERRESGGSSSRDNENTLERRNDPSGRERSLPPVQPRNDPSGEERNQSQSLLILEPNEIREVPGSGINPPESVISSVDGGIRQIPGGISPMEVANIPNNRSRVVTGSQETNVNAMQDQLMNETRNKREEAVGASITEEVVLASGSPNRRDSYEDGDDEKSGNSRDGSRERKREPSPTDRRRYDYDRKTDHSFYEREREFDDDYYYDRRRTEYDRSYNSREDLDRRETSFREGDRRHREDSERHPRDDERRGRSKDEDGRDLRRREERRSQRPDDPRRQKDGRDFDPRYPRANAALGQRDREYPDRDRRRDDRRRRYEDYDPRDPRREYYEDPYARSSRPSSRSSYNDHDRDYYMRNRDPYYSHSGWSGYDYGTNYNTNYYTYYENLRRTNPAAYSEWYHTYYANQLQQQNASRVGSNYPEDGASVHSGRSSGGEKWFVGVPYHTPNEALYVPYFGFPGWGCSSLKKKRPSCCRKLNRTTNGKQPSGDMSLLEDPKTISRMTPTKFSTSHVRGSFSIGSFLHVHPSYPADGERARVDILRIDSLLLHDPIARELRSYPGPLIRGVTHKKTIIEYCEAQIKKATANDSLIDHASYILLYQLLIMLIQQNGNVVGVDIAALLLRNKESYPYDLSKQTRGAIRRESVISQRSGGTGGDGSVHEFVPESGEPVKPEKTVEQMTDEFRNYLLYGLVQEALEYAMTGGLWGHALFLASKLDKRTHASVMTRFANSLPIQDPLQTLYQLHSGRVPASVTCLSDWKWDDWRPHLAMIISNTSANPDINRRAITTLGDTLAARGDIHAAHFCYILAQNDFGLYGSANVKLVLIGANHNKNYADFATSEAVMLTEIYEYARNLSEPGYTLVGLQSFKFENAQKMADYGLMEKALLYLEQIALNIISEPSKYEQTFINDVYTLSERIKFHDPVFKDSTEDETVLTWINNLGDIVGRCETGEIIQADDIQAHNILQDQENVQQQQQNQWNHPGHQQEYNNGAMSMIGVPSADVPQDQWQPLSLPTNIQEQYNPDEGAQYASQSVDQTAHYHQQQQQQQQDYWAQQQTYNQQEYTTADYGSSDWQHQQENQSQYQPEQTEMDSVQQNKGWNYGEKEEKPTSTESQPQISMGPTSNKQYDPLEELDALDHPNDDTKLAADNNNKKSTEKPAEKKTPNSSGGSWFGGIFSKLAPKPKNQMILPDDTNPTIVWDPVAKKWMNKDDSGETSARLAPPPKATDMGFRTNPITDQSSPMPQPMLNPPIEDATTPNSSKIMTGNNMFKLQKGRGMRANYIDVMNPNAVKGNGPPSNVPTPATSPMVPMAASSPQLFIPTPINNANAPLDFLTPTPTLMPSSDPTSQGLSRWSSASSLSREVQSYTTKDPRIYRGTKGPMMYNPANMRENTTKNAPRNIYTSR